MTVRALGSTSLSKSQATEFEGFATSAASQALQFLWGRGQLDALFNLDWCSEECPKGEGQKLLELRPKKPLATLERMVVQIDAGDVSDLRCYFLRSDG